MAGLRLARGLLIHGSPYALCRLQGLQHHSYDSQVAHRAAVSCRPDAANPCRAPFQSARMTAVGSPASSSDELGRLLEQELGDEIEASAVEVASDATEGQGAVLPRTPELNLVDPTPLPPASIDTTLTSAAPVLSSTDAAMRPGKRRKTDSVQGENPSLTIDQHLRHT